MILVRQGNIVGCNFPLVEQPNIPGEKRPAMVLQVAEEIAAPHQRWALVAYASGQGGTAGNETLLPHQMEIFASAENGLSCPTVFSLSRTVWLRLNDDWFPGVEQGKAIWGRPRREEFEAAQKLQGQAAICGVSDQPKISGGINVGGANPGSISDLGKEHKPLITHRRRFVRPPPPGDTE